MSNLEVLRKAEAGFRESNKILIRGLMRDLEEKGIKPVIGLDGQVAKLKLANLKSNKLFLQVLEKFKKLKEDFCILEIDQSKYKADETYEINGKLIIVCKTSGKIKTYNSNKKTSWIADFKTDLKNKFFS